MSSMKMITKLGFSDARENEARKARNKKDRKVNRIIVLPSLSPGLVIGNNVALASRGRDAFSCAMQLALPNATGDLFTLDEEIIRAGIEGSCSSPRKRMIYPIHRNQSDLVQRMLNFFQPGTYVTPHLHPRESASELVFLIQGRLGFLLFDEKGNITSQSDLKPGALIDLEPKLWHTMVVLEPDTVVLEVKRGPFDSEDKIFADWAPGEGDPEAENLVREFEGLFLEKERK